MFNYHLHVTEYGTHWNFFLSISAVMILSAFTASFSLQSKILTVVVIQIINQLSLYHFGLREYILDEVRVGFI